MIVNNLPSDYRWLTLLENELFMTEAVRIPDVIQIKVGGDESWVDLACPASVPANSTVPDKYLEFI